MTRFLTGTGARFDKPLPAYSLIEAKRHAGEPETAATLLRQALEKHPGDAQLWRMLLDVTVSDLQDKNAGQQIVEEGKEALTGRDRETFQQFAGWLGLEGGNQSSAE